MIRESDDTLDAEGRLNGSLVSAPTEFFRPSALSPTPESKDLISPIASQIMVLNHESEENQSGCSLARWVQGLGEPEGRNQDRSETLGRTGRGNNRVERVCEVCGETLVGWQKKFCSRQCCGIWQRENHPSKNGKDITCKVCGKEFYVCKYDLEVRKARFCSYKCRGEATRRENSPHWKGEFKFICEMCGKAFTVMNYRLKDNPRFCSKKCQALWQSESAIHSGANNPSWKGGGVTIPCEYCKKDFEIALWNLKMGYEHRFCSRECYGKWSKTRLGEDSPGWRGGKINAICDSCGTAFNAFPSATHGNSQFCSWECYCEFSKGPNTSGWRGGISFLPHSPTFTERLKETIRERDGRTCQYCGISESELDKRLSIHHINYGKETTDDIEDNLISLCISCHVMTNAHRWFWEAYFNMKIQEKDSIQSRLHPIMEVKKDDTRIK